VADTAIYLDHAATTPVDPAVLAEMLPFFSERFGNPSSIYGIGRDARTALDYARGSLAQVLNCHPRELVMTSGATEANNLAIKGVAWSNRLKATGRNHVVTTAIEHPAVLQAVSALGAHGFESTLVMPDSDGIVSPDAIEAAIRDDTCLISVMHANNEIGVIQPVEQIASLAHGRGILMHCDAVQSAGYLDVDVTKLGVDLMTLSAHKFYGPKGVGLLFVRKGIDIDWQQLGGGQENARRGGTENVPGIVGMAAALRLAAEERSMRSDHARPLRDRLFERILENIPQVTINGHRTQRLPNNVNVSFEGVNGETILLALDIAGVAASSGSACSTGSTEPSHVLLALGRSPGLAGGSLRLTVGKDNTLEEIDRALAAVVDAVFRVRELVELAG
jgi:cysteine desulfurase